LVTNLRLSIEGDTEWKRKLQSARSDIGDEMEKAVLRGLLRIEGGAKRRLDNDVLQRRTSTLFRSVNHRFTRRGVDSFGEVGSPIVYGPTHEFGHEFNNAFGRGIKVRIPKRPWLQPSFDEVREEILADIRRAVGKGLDA
jgi:hypothetical protein